ncbi:MAG: hypothetical protein ORN49_03120 [Rhodobacteraceae bacterium]|nr:hypothetical protein [Paracoccaceae bacterium]
MNLTYLFDPLCGWCYGAGPVLKHVAGLPGIRLDLVPTGLFARGDGRQLDRQISEHIWSMDQRISALSGQEFSESYRTKVLGQPEARLSSAAATLALTAVTETNPEAELDALSAIQTARYVGGLDITSDLVLADCLIDLKLTAAAELFADRSASLIAKNAARIEQGEAAMALHHLNGVPALLHDRGGQYRPIDSGLLFGNPERLTAALAIREIENQTEKGMKP